MHEYSGNHYYIYWSLAARIYIMILPILLFSACSNNEGNVTSSLCVRHCHLVE